MLAPRFLVALAIPGALTAQPAARPAFDAASVRPAAAWQTGGEGSRRSKIEYSPKSVTMRNVDLSECVQWAYGVEFYRISGAKLPDSDHYDIQGRTENPVTLKQLRAMLQDLLETRFHLASHRETKLQPALELTVAKGGPTLPKPKPDAPTHAAESLPRVQDGGFVFENVTLPEFAAMLSQLRTVALPVIDKTGIPGVFDLSLKSAADAILQPDGPSISTLLQEQLGLKLVAAKAPMEMIVIDRVGALAQ